MSNLENSKSILSQFYGRHYRNEKHDSPEESRVSMIRRMVAHLSDGTPGNKILDIGAGRQSLERQLFSFNPHIRLLLESLEITTIDLADLNSRSLLAKRSGVHHIQSQGESIPLPDNKFSLVVSNHALDFMPRTAFKDAYRVTTPGGLAILYFHHPCLIDTDLNKVKNPLIKAFWTYLKTNKVLFQNEHEIENTLTQAGFTPTEITTNSDGQDTWWETTSIK